MLSEPMKICFRPYSERHHDTHNVLELSHWETAFNVQQQSRAHLTEEPEEVGVC